MCATVRSNLPTSAVREASPPNMKGFRVLILVCELHAIRQGTVSTEWPGGLDYLRLNSNCGKVALGTAMLGQHND